VTICPKCKKELTELDENIIDETEECSDIANARDYECPNCGCDLIVYIKVDCVEIGGFEEVKEE